MSTTPTKGAGPRGATPDRPETPIPFKEGITTMVTHPTDSRRTSAPTSERTDTFTRPDGVEVQQRIVEFGSVDVIRGAIWSGTARRPAGPEQLSGRIEMPLLRVYVGGTASDVLLSVEDARALVHDLNAAIDSTARPERGSR